jgi:hypothetical protein
MTGFRAPRTTYRLEFDQPDFADLVIKVRGTTLDELFELDEAQEAIVEARGIEDVRTALRHRNSLFVDKVTEWNLEDDDGASVPCTVDALGSLEAPFVTATFNAWRRVASGAVPAPLDRPSAGGEPSPEVESTLLAIPSESLAS